MTRNETPHPDSSGRAEQSASSAAANHAAGDLGLDHTPLPSDPASQPATPDVLATLSPFATFELKRDGSLRLHHSDQQKTSVALETAPASGDVADADAFRTMAAPVLGGDGLDDQPLISTPGSPPDVDSGDARFSIVTPISSHAGDAIDSRDASVAPAFTGFDNLEGVRLPPAGYQLDEMIGRGGQGEVWSAFQGSLHRSIAVKVQHSGSMTEFLAEACTTAGLQHPNIVPVHELTTIEFEGKKRPALAMKRIQGTTWSTQLALDRAAIGTGAPLSVDEDNDAAQSASTPATYALADHLATHLPILISVCNAVAFAHSRGILHRDLKPHQVLLGEFGEVYLLDWGLAVSLEENVPLLPPDDIPKHHTLSAATWLAGTPAYMAPEQAGFEDRPIGVHTDIYLLGAILFEIVSGRAPHPGNDAREAFQAARDNILVPMDKDVPEALLQLMASSLSTEASDRPTSAASFRETLREYLAGAGRRRESEQLTNDAMARMNSLEAVPSISELGAINVELERAIAAWGDNRRALAAREKLAALHADAALDAGDLDHAAYFAQSAPLADRGRLEVTIGRARRERVRIGKQRRLAIVCVGVLLVALIGGSWFSTWRIGRARDEALRNSRNALEQGTRARRVNEFVLHDLLRYLDPRNPRDAAVADSVITAMIADINETDTSDWSEDLMLEFVAHLTSVAGTLFELDLDDDAESLLNRAYSIASQHAEGNEDQLAVIHMWRALNASDRGDFVLAIEESGKALALARTYVPSEEDEHIVDLFLSVHSKVLLAAGRIEEAEKYVEELLDSPEGSIRESYRWDKLAQLRLQQGRLDEAFAASRRAFELEGMQLDSIPTPGVGMHVLWYSMFNIVHARKDVEAALRIGSAMPDLIIGIYGGGHSEMIRGKKYHAMALALAGRHHESAEQYEEATRLAQTFHQEVSPLVIDARREYIALIRDHLGEQERAAREAESLRKDIIERFGPDSQLLEGTMEAPDDEGDSGDL